MIVLDLLTENSRWVPLLHLKRSEGQLNVLNRGLSRTYICFFKISISIALWLVCLTSNSCSLTAWYRSKNLWYVSFCSSLFTDPLFSLQSPSSARDKKQKPRGIYWPPAEGVWGWGRRKFFNFLSCAPRSFSLANVFEKNEKNNKTASVFRLVLFSRFVLFK